MSSTQVLSNDLSINETIQIDGSEVTGFIVEGQKKHEVKKGCNKMGRDPEMCSIVLECDTVSKLHCVIDSEGKDDTFIYDVGSTNRTKLGKRYLKPHCRYKLEHGSMITLGNVVVYFITSFHSTIYCPQWLGTKMISYKLGDQISNFEDLFELETQVNIPLHNVGNGIISHSAVLDGKIAPKCSKSSSLGGDSASVKNHCKKNNEHIFKKILESQLTSQHDIYLNDNLANCSIFDAETQCQIESTSSKKILLKNIIDKNEICNEKIPTRIVLNNCHDETVCDLSSSNLKKFVIKSVSLENSNDASLTQLQEKSSPEIGVTVQGYINMEEEIELLKTNTKFNKNLEDNFLHENKIKDQKTNLKSKDSSVVSIKTVSNDFNQEFHFKSNASNENKKDFDLDDDTKNLFLLANKNVTNCDTNELTVKKDNDRSQERRDPDIESKRDENINSLLFEENSLSESESYLEITIENIVEEKTDNVVSSQSNLNAQKFKSSCTKDDAEFNENNQVRVGIFQKQCENNIEIKTDCPANPGSLNNSYIFSHHKETKELNASKNVIMTPRFDCSLSQILNNKNNTSTTEDSSSSRFFHMSTSPESLLETAYFNSIKRRCSKAQCLLDSDSIEETPITYCDKRKEILTIVTNDLPSFVPESSDEENTKSDLEIIENSPNFKISNNALIHSTPVNECVNNSINPNLKSPELENFNLDYSDDNSESSYVFEIVSDLENLNDLEAKNQTNRNEFQDFISDSDTNDVIDSTPPKTKKMANKNFSSVILKKVNETKVLNLKLPNKSVASNSNELHKRCNANQTGPNHLCVSNAAGSFSNVWAVEETPILTTEQMHNESNETKRETMNVKNKLDRKATMKAESEKICISAKRNLKESEPFSNRILDDAIVKRTRMEKCSSKIIPRKKLRGDDNRRVDLHLNGSVRLSDKSEGKHFFNLGKNHDKIQSKRTEEKKRFEDDGTSVQMEKRQVNYRYSLPNQSSSESESRRRVKSGGRNSDANARKNLTNPDGVSNENSKCKKSLFAWGKSSAFSWDENHPGVNGPALKDLERHPAPKNDRPRREKRAEMNDSYFGNSLVRIAFTGFDSETLDKIIKELGGEKTSDLRCGQVLVTDQFRRTVKFLCAIGLSIPITSPDWLLASKKKNKFLNPWNYILKCEESEKKWNFNLKETLEKAREKKLLNGYRIFATESVKPPAEDILSIAECCGGIPIRDRPEKWPGQTIFVSCLEDEKSWPSWKFRSVKIVHFEFVVSGVLKQVLDFKTYKLR